MRLLPWLALGALLGALVGYAEGEDTGSIVINAIAGIVLVAILRPDRAMRRRRSAKTGSEPTSGPSRFAIAGVVLAALALLAAVAYVIKGASNDEAPGLLWRDASVELRPVSALKGIALGQALEEVTARWGAFDRKAPATAGDAASPGDEYQQAGGSLRLRVEGGRVRRVSYECRAGDATRVNRIACHDPERRILEVFGNGARRLCARVAASEPGAALAPGVFAFDVLDAGTRYVSVQGVVKGFIVMSPPDLEAALGGALLWHRCG